MGNQQNGQIQMQIQNEIQVQVGQQKSEIEVEFLLKVVDVERRNRWIRCFKEFNINTMEELIQSYGLDKKSKVGRRCNEAEHIILNDYFLKKQKVYNVDPILKFLQTQDYLSDQLITDTALIDSQPFIIKNILIVGITGQGKTTFINSLVTYLKGFNTPNSYKTFNDRYYVAEIKTQEVKSDTQQVNSYQIIHKNYIFNLIDTPGLADTQGFEADQKRVSQISEYLQNNLQKKNQLLHGILIVSQSSTQYEVQDGNRTLLQMAMLSILKLFGKNMCGYTTHILSFSDFTTTNIRNFESPNSIFYALTVEQSQQFSNQKNTQQFNSASAQDFDNQKEQRSFQQYIQFQNSVFQAKEIGFIEKIQIKKNIENYDNLCKRFIESEGFPLDTTCEVIETRENLKIQIKEILQNLKSLTNAKKRIQDSIKKIDIFLNKAKDSENFEYIDYVTICKRVFQEKEGVYFTNCLTCSKTCCNECQVTNIKLKDCLSMQEQTIDNQKFYICQCGCSVDQHINERFRWIFKTDEVKNINQDLKSEYDKAINLKEEAEKSKVQLENLLIEVRQEIYQGIASLKECLENLLTSALYNFDISDYEATEYIEKCYPDYKDIISEFHSKEELKIKPEVKKQQKEKIMHSMTLLGIKTIQFQDT